MYREAAEHINKGLSVGARIVLGASSLLLAMVVLGIEAPPENAAFVYAFAGFCVMIALACVVKGRLRQFAGSVIGVGLFVIALLYVGSELGEGKLFSGSRSEPSVFNALMFTFFFGVPGLAYAFKARFGFGKR